MELSMSAFRKLKISKQSQFASDTFLAKCLLIILCQDVVPISLTMILISTLRSPCCGCYPACAEQWSNCVFSQYM